MTPDLFDAARQDMLRALRLWLAAGADLADVEDEIKATARAMWQLAALRLAERQRV